MGNKNKSGTDANKQDKRSAGFASGKRKTRSSPRPQTTGKAGVFSSANAPDYRVLVENSPDMFFTTDLVGAFTYVSAQCARYGYQPDDLLGHNFTEFAASEYRLPLERQLAEIGRGEMSVPLQALFRMPDGREYWLEIVARRLLDKDDRVSGIIGIARDVSERKAAEEAFAKASHRMTEMIGRLPVGVFRRTPEGNFIEINQTLWELFEADSRKEMMGRNINALYSKEIDFKELNEEVQKTGVARRELLMNTLKGRPMWVSISVVKRTDSTGYVYIDGVMEDVTARVIAEQKNRALDMLKNKFITIVSHQMRTPLASVRWSLEEVLGKKVGDLPDAQRELLNLAFEANKEVITRIDDLIMAMDIEGGNVRLEKEVVSLEDLINGTRAEFQTQMAAKKCRLEYEYPPDQPTEVNADPRRLRDAIVRLIDNAISYSKEDGVVKLRVNKAGGHARLEVIDNGIGIPQSEKPHLFQRFHRAANAFTAKPDSSGLGLYIIKNVVEAHGGTVGFESEEGKGSTFWIELPLAR